MQTHIEQFNYHISTRLYKCTLFLMFLCFLLLLTFGAYSQTYNVHGNVSTNTTPVKYASVTFIDQSDTSKKYTAITDTAGNYQISIITSVKEKPTSLPTRIELEQNYPNPFSATTSITYTTKQPADVKITIYDILGREIETLVNEKKFPGSYTVRYNATEMPSGIYFYSMITTSQRIKKIC